MNAGVASLYLQGAGAGMNGIGAYYGAKAQKANLQLQADVAEYNARQAERSAQYSILSGQRAEQGSRLRTAGIKSKQKVGYAANGVDLSSDSAVENLTTTDVMGEIDANTIAENAIREAWGFRAQGANYTAEAGMARATASGINPLTSALGAAIGGGSQVAGNWYYLNKAGALG